MSRLGWVMATVWLVAACGNEPAFPSAIDCPGDTQISGDPVLPKNVIFIMGDGMGPLHLRAGEIEADAPLAITSSLEGPVYVNTDSVTTDRTLDSDSAPTDSAAGATALASGVRTLNGMVGVDADGNAVETVAEIAKSQGKSVGLVTTTFVYDASPGAFVAHTADRDLVEDVVNDVLTNAQPDLMFGAGQEVFDANGGELATLAAEQGYVMLRDAAGLASWDPSTEPRVLGLFPTAPAPVPGVYDWGLTPMRLRTADTPDPRLTVMASRALERLSSDPDGFFLFIENEHIDTLGHVALVVTQTAVDGIPLEVAELDATVRIVLDWVAESSSFDETLVVVGADHENGGYRFDGDDPSTASFPNAPLHTRLPVPVYAAGPGAENIGSLCRVSDVFLLLTGRLPAP
jgi:alkaline phosphatase